ncbi:hypothetical protein ACWEWU_09445 [Staphylococcus xylosus]
MNTKERYLKEIARQLKGIKIELQKQNDILIESNKEIDISKIRREVSE